MIPYESEGVIKTQGKIVCPHCNLEIETQKPKIILQKPKLLIVEGKDDECFFCALIDYLRIEDIQVAGAGGKNQIRGQLRAIVKDDDFNKVTSLGVIRDANNNPDDAFKSVINALKAAGLTAPKRTFIAIDGSPKVAVMIIPSHKRKGALEDLCLDAIADNPAFNCVNEYFVCLENRNIDPPKEISKAKVHVFLSSRKDPALPLGISAQKGFWPLDHKAFENVKKFLQSL